MSEMAIGVVIPAFNVEFWLEDVLSQVFQYISPSRVWVVDDGSKDRTALIAKKQGANLYQHSENRGKGEALKSGFQKVLLNRLDGVITLDGDAQHNPGFIPNFIRRAQETGCDLILGTRKFYAGRMPLDRIFSNSFSSFLVSLWAGKRIPDSQCGFRLIRSAVLKKVHLQTSHYETETELLIKAIWQGFRFSTCSIQTEYKHSISNIHRLTDTIRFCTLLVHLLQRKR